MSAAPPPPKTVTPSPAITALIRGCIWIIIKVLAVLLLLSLLPFLVLFALVYLSWPWYSSVPTAERDLSNALVALAGVAGVLWSGAIVAYSIHKKYTPPLRTGVQLLCFAILAPLAGLIAAGAELRTAFYFTMWFYIFDTLYSVTNLEMLKPKFTLRPPPPDPNETPEQAEAREQIVERQLKRIEFFQRAAHGTPYFALVSILCLVTFITASTITIAWSCLLVLVVSLFLMLPQVFDVSDMGQGRKTTQDPPDTPKSS